MPCKHSVQGADWLFVKEVDEKMTQQQRERKRVRKREESEKSPSTLAPKLMACVKSRDEFVDKDLTLIEKTHETQRFLIFLSQSV